MKTFYEFNQKDITFVGGNELQQLITKAHECGYRKYRLCLQHSADEMMQQMINVALKGEYRRPHKHLNIPEANHILVGEMLIFVFDENGNVIEKERLSPEGVFLFRVEKGYYHVSIPLTDEIVYLETKLGPFKASTNIFPEWAPDGKNELLGKKYMEELEKNA